MTTSRTIDIQGGRLYFEVRGEGPLVLVMGAPMDTEAFAPLADALATDHTVVTHDPRGISRSTLDDPTQDSTPELRADDVVAILDALGAESADVFGTSGGAVSVLALAERHPNRVRTVIAHEPPLLELLPDADVHRAATDETIAAFHRDGLEAAWMSFMATAGYDLDEMAEPEGEPSEQEIANSARFFAHELRDTTRHNPDIAALRAAKIVVGIGVESHGLLTYPTSNALAKLLDVAPVDFPGEHTGFMPHPEEFADAMRKVLLP